MLLRKSILSILAVILLGSCQSPLPVGPEATETPSPAPTETLTPSPIPTETPSPTPTATPIVVGPSGFPENVNRLTGLTVDDLALLNRRPVLVKVANFPRDGRPHSGLSQADIVFDYYVGAGMNRFAAIYYGQDAEVVNPVRSCRLLDIQLTNMYRGIVACVYADANYVWPQLVDGVGYYRIFAEGTNSCPALCRDYEIGSSVNSVVANTAELTKWSVRREVDDGTRYNLEGMAFDSRPPGGSLAGDFVSVNYFSRNRAEWVYEPASGRYLRWIEEIDAEDNLTMIPLVDRNTGEQLAFDNIILLLAEYTEYDELLHNAFVAGDPDGGQAYLFRDGLMYYAHWRSYGMYRVLQFFDGNGNPLPLKPGQSWIYILGNRTELGELSPGHWEAHFYLP